MNPQDLYESAKGRYAALGIDTDEALRHLAQTSIAMHCWQGDDVAGFEGPRSLDGGIQATGTYPGKARSPEELMSDMDAALRLIPGRHKLNLHASYAIIDPQQKVERNQLEPGHFAPWAAFARERGMSIDFNPTLFSHPMVRDGLTLSSPESGVREFWIGHCQACIRIAGYFARETGKPCVMNIWIPDGFKDLPADRLGPRQRFCDALDEILGIPYDKTQVFITLESKVFGIGLESYTVGSAEFCLGYAASRGIIPLLDNGHYHPTEMVSDKISSLLLFHPRIALHITRPVRWDSDHVVLYDDETRELCKEIVRCKALDRVFLATDYFDASINRIAAWVIGMRNVQKALLFALLQPDGLLRGFQDASRMTELMVWQEELKLLPLGDVWNWFCLQQGVPAGMDWFVAVKDYEHKVLSKRQERSNT